MTTIYRQGDVLITRITKLPADLKPVDREGGRIILAHGELTGHAHAIADKHVTLRQTAAGQLFLEILESAASLKHEEHSTVTLPPGLYRVARQVEYSPAALRNVAD